MRYQLAIFDLDGTLLNTLEDLKDALNHGLREYGFAERSDDEVRRFLGHGFQSLVERGVPAGTSKEKTRLVFGSAHQYYAIHCADKTVPYNGVLHALRTLRERGIRTAVVSNKPDHAVQALCKQYFDGWLDSAVGAKEGVRKKPFPDAVEAVLRHFCLSADRAVYIGDSDVDVQTAANAQMDGIIVDWGFRTREELIAAGAKRIVSTEEDLLAAILTGDCFSA